MNAATVSGREPDDSLGVCIVLNALTVAIVVFFVVFYFFPHKVVFLGTGFAAATGVFWFLYNSFSSYGARVWSFRRVYVEGILTHPRWAFVISVILFLAATLWTGLMLGAIKDRFYYLRALDRAIPFVEGGQIGIPAPEDIAQAFNHKPERPEVPFILMRSARLLTSDDNYDGFYLYMKKFLAAVDKEGVIERGKDFRSGYKLAEDGEASALPLLDPIRLLAAYMVEVPNAEQEAAYGAAIALLEEHRNGANDDAAKLQRLLYETERDLEIRPAADPCDHAKRVDEKIRQLELYANPAATNDAFRVMALVTDHIYQQALDALAYYKASRIVESAGRPANPATPKCTTSAPVDPDAKPTPVELYQRILSIRTRLMSQTDVVWWQASGKLTLYCLFAELSEKHNTNGAIVYKQFERHQPLLDAMKKLHMAAAYKSFQDPETWSVGTPLAKSFSGSASAAQLRRWMQLGWDWSS